MRGWIGWGKTLKSIVLIWALCFFVLILAWGCIVVMIMKILE